MKKNRETNEFLNDDEAVKVSKFQKYRWVYLGVASILLLGMAILMLINPKNFGNKIVVFLTGGVFIAYVVIRFIPLVKTLKSGWAVAINIIELVVDLAAGICMIVLPVTIEDNEGFFRFYGFFVGGVFWLRGFVYWLESSFFNTKAEPVKFILHLVAISLGAGLITLAFVGKLTVDWFRYMFVVAAALCFVFAFIDATINYNNYRKLYAKKEKAVKKEDAVSEAKETPVGDDLSDTPIIQEPDNRQQDYVS